MLNLQDVERDLDNLHRTQAILDRVVSEAEAPGVFLVDNDGFLVAEAGEIENDRVALAALIAASFGATAEVARILGEASFNKLTHQGEKNSLFVIKAGERHILIVVFGSETNLGLVKLYAEQASEALGEFLDNPNKAEQKEGEEEGGEEGEEGEGMFPAWLDGNEDKDKD
jgi:predicted regulator of Ras-like GTPase activity (Roadblock/LC7/MglB family)